MILIVGLGNPGEQYRNTRHNMGFQVVEKCLKKYNLSLNREDFHSSYVKTRLFDQDVIFCTPLTFMNLSGQTLIEITHFFKIDIEDILIIYDDMDTPVGKIKIKQKGSSGGQKGMQSIIEMMHTDEIKRIKIGIGKSQYSVVDYVLGVPNKEEKEQIDIAQDRALQAIEAILKYDFNYALSRYNQ